MKLKFIIVFSILCSLSPVPAQGQKDKASTPTFIHVPLDVPIFTPPEQVELQPLARIRIDSSITVPSASGKTLTFQRGTASTLPDIPQPLPPEPEKFANLLSAAELAIQLNHYRHSISLGATVYSHKVSVLNWTDHETQTKYKAVCGFDIGLIAGIGSFIRDGEEYSVDLGPGDIALNEAGIWADAPKEALNVIAGQILITEGDPKAHHATALLYYIKDLIDGEKQRLIIYQAARKQYQLAANAWAIANPPIPRDETFLIRPHRGSRYIAQPQPENKEVAR